MTIMQQRLLSPEEIASQPPTRIPVVLLPGATDVFTRRAQRLRALAPDHPAGPYLTFIARIADLQQQALDDAGPPAPEDAEAVQQARSHGFPPLPLIGHPLDAAWRDALRRIVAGAAPQLPAAARPVAERLAALPDDALDQQAHRLLAGVALGLDTATAPFIGAALQVHATRRVLGLPAGTFASRPSPSLCPCCGSPPVAGIVHIGGDAAGLRYLQCSLCSTQWHMVRIKCARCQTTKGISYYAADGDERPAHEHAVMAEACSECGAYTKIAYMNRDPAVDACADDLATLSLDLLMNERRFTRWGVNFMLLHGESGDDDAAGHRAAAGGVSFPEVSP